MFVFGESAWLPARIGVVSGFGSTPESTRQTIPGSAAGARTAERARCGCGLLHRASGHPDLGRRRADSAMQESTTTPAIAATPGILCTAARVMINKIGPFEPGSVSKRGVVGLGDRPEVILDNTERGPRAAPPALFEAT